METEHKYERPGEIIAKALQALGAPSWAVDGQVRVVYLDRLCPPSLYEDGGFLWYDVDRAAFVSRGDPARIARYRRAIWRRLPPAITWAATERLRKYGAEGRPVGKGAPCTR